MPIYIQEPVINRQTVQINESWSHQQEAHVINVSTFYLHMGFSNKLGTYQTGFNAPGTSNTHQTPPKNGDMFPTHDGSMGLDCISTYMNGWCLYGTLEGKYTSLHLVNVYMEYL